MKNETRPGAGGLEDFKIRQLQSRVDELCRRIQNGISLELFFAEENKLRDFCAKRFPDKMETYDLIYRARFMRFWSQFRNVKIEFKEETQFA